MTAKIVKEVVDWIKIFIIAWILAYLVHSFLFTVVIVSGPSMEPTLHNNERLTMNKFIYKLSTPKRGDIVVFHATDDDDYIKRVIGEPGDNIEYKENQLYINGQVINEDYIPKIEMEDFGPVTIPENNIFVMGDNRLNSTDSRILGTIPLNKVIGRTKFIIWPLNRMKILD